MSAFALQIRTDVGVELGEKLLESPVTCRYLLQPVDIPRQNARFAPSFYCIWPLLQLIHLCARFTPRSCRESRSTGMVGDLTAVPWNTTETFPTHQHQHQQTSRPIKERSQACVGA